MKREWKFILRRGALGALLFLVSLLHITDAMLGIRLGDPNLDFAWVLLSLAMPHLIRMAALGVLFSAIFFALKLLTMPRSRVEKSMYSLKKHRLLKNTIYAGLAAAPLLFPVKSGTSISQLLGGVAAVLPPYLMPLLAPSYAVAYMDVLLFLEALLFAFFLVHLVRVFSLGAAEVEPVVGKRVFEEGSRVRFRLRSSSPLPLLSFPQLPFKLRARSTSSALKNSHEVVVEGKLPVGYYRFDVLKYSVATLPFFFSSFHKVTSEPVEITVLPKIKVKNVVYTRNPFTLREGGGLIKKVSGSSLEFANVRRFTPGDPIARVWWKGLAKTGELMTKDFYSPAEDRWVLLVDLTDPGLDEAKEKALLSFCRGFVEIFTRKDVEVSIHLLSTNHTYIDYSTNKRALLSFLIRHWSEFRHLSHEGARAVLGDALGKGVDEVEERCKNSGISLSSFLFYSGLLKEQKRFFQWSRRSTARESLLEVTKKLRKSGKMLVVTGGMPRRMVEEVRKVARARKCSLLFASFQKIPRTRSYIIPEKKPEKAAWRLMYA